MGALSAMNPLVLAAAGVVGIVVCGWIAIRPQRGVLIFAALSPLHYMLMIVPGGQSLLPWKEALLTFTLFAAAFRYRGAGFRVLRAPWAVPFGIFVLIGIISAGLTLPLSAALSPIKITFFYGIVITLIGLLAPWDARDRDNLITIMMVMAVCTGLFGIWQEIVSPDVLISMGFEWNRDIRTAGGGQFIRAISTFGQPFPFALYEMIALIVCGTVAVTDRTRLRNKIFLWLTPVCLIAMTTAIVRAAFLGLLVALIFLGIRHHRRILEWMGALAALGALAAVIFSGPLLSTFLSSSSLGERGSGWSESVASILRHPFGIGLGATGSAAEKVALATGATSVPYQPDNYYMKVLIELGPLGLWAFAGTLAVAFLYCNRTYTNADNSGDRALALGTAASLPAIAAASLVSTYFEIFPLDAYFWLMLTAVMSITVYSGRSPAEPYRLSPQPFGEPSSATSVS